MTVLTETEKSFYITTAASLIESDHDTASSWATKHIVSNEALKWVIGKYVEADNANSNGQYWTLKDLQMKRPTITYSPMNMSHQAHNIVGTFVASDLIYPTEDSAAQAQNPYIEALGVFWRYYFPDELDDVEKAYKEGNLFLSMECVGESVTCGGPEGCGETFPYKGPMHDSYCDHIKERASYRQLNNPHFLAGALVLPPDGPGWKGAEVKEISRALELPRAQATMEELVEQNPKSSIDVLEYATLLLTLDQLSQPKVPATAIGRRIGEELLSQTRSFSRIPKNLAKKN